MSTSGLGKGQRPSLAARILPGVQVLRHYDKSWLRGDLLAGITVAAYLVPQVMAYAEVAGMPAIAGLWAILGPLAIYAVFGSSRQLSSGPESTTALMTATVVASLATGASVDRAGLTAAVAVVVGLICVVGYLARLGFLANLLSSPVLAGYMAGIAVLMVVSQLGKITGVKPHGDSLVEAVIDFARRLREVHLPTLALAAAVLVLLFAFRAVAPKLPGPLIAMLLAAGAVLAFNLTAVGIKVIGDVPAGLPVPQLPSFAGVDWFKLLPAAVGIALVGYSDNVLTARAFAAKRKERIDAAQEFLALGLANISAGLMHGFPVSSSGSRTVLGDAMGSRTQVYSLTALAAVIATLLFGGPMLASFPQAALGGVVVYAAIRLIDVAELRRIARFRRSELVLSLATTVSVLVFDVLAGIGIAVALSLLDLLRRLARPHDGILGYVPGMAGMHDIDDYATARQIPGLVVYRYDSPLFFANSEDFLRRALAAVDDSQTPVQWFLLNAEANTEVDLTAVDTLERLHDELAARDIVLALARVKFETQEQLEVAGFVDRVGADRIFATLPTGVAAYADWFADKHGYPPPGPPIPPAPLPRASGDRATDDPRI